MWTGCRRSCRRKDQSSGAVRHILRSDCQQSSVAPEREERLVDVGPLVIPHAQVAKLTEPGKMCAPRPTAKAASMLRAAHGRQGHDVPNPETVRMAAAPSPRCPSTQSGRCRGRLHALRSGGNRIHQRESFLRVVPFAPVRRPANGTPPPSQIRWLLPRLVRSVGFGPVWSPPCTHGGNNYPRSRPINLSSRVRPIQERKVDQIPHRRPVASRARDASTSSPTRTRVPAGASATEYRCKGRRQCR